MDVEMILGGLDVDTDVEVVVEGDWDGATP